MEEALPVVFIMDMTDAYRRTAFIKAHISFIVPDSQIYLPFMGTCLEEKYRMEIQKYLKGKCTPDEILRMLKSSLSSPVADVLYIDKEIARKSIRSDLSDGEVRGDKDQSLIIVSTDEEKGYPCYAANKKGFRCDGSHELLNAETGNTIRLYLQQTVMWIHCHWHSARKNLYSVL